MAEKSSIGWTEATWNPWIGCTRVSPGCAHCYMARLEGRWGRNPWAVRRTSPATWRIPLHLKEPSMIFSCSMSDFFHEAADAWRSEAWEIIRATPRHTYQILTKRPERIAGHLPPGWPLPNVWLGVSIEYQRWAQIRVPLLVQIPTVLRFLSCEPLLGPLDLRPWLALSAIQWVIAGGESGEKPRPLNLNWVRALRDECLAAGVPFFYKQSGGRPYPNEKEAILDGRYWREVPPLRNTQQLSKQALAGQS